MTISKVRRPFRFACLAIFFDVVTLGSATTKASSPLPSPIVDIELLKPFNTRSPWRFVATQDPSVFEPIDPALIGLVPKGFTGSETPGVIHLCLQRGRTAPCDPGLVAMPQPPAPFPYSEWEPHYLNNAKLVYPRGQTVPPLLLLQTASAHSGDGDQAVFTQLLTYSRARDRFEQIYAKTTGRNNNQEVRFIMSGPLQGDMISVEPTANSPFAYWVTVDILTQAVSYKRALHYRSATRYDDGNTLSVIDSEMPNILHHLGLWLPGMPLLLPARPCQKPQLSNMELWCE